MRTNIVHIAPCHADIHPTIHAVPRPDILLPRQVVVCLNLNDRRGRGIEDTSVTSVIKILKNVLEDVKKQFWDQMPRYMQIIQLGRLQAL